MGGAQDTQDTPVTPSRLRCPSVAQRPQRQAASRKAWWGPACWRRSSPAAVKCLHTRTANLGVEGMDGIVQTCSQPLNPSHIRTTAMAKSGHRQACWARPIPSRLGVSLMSVAKGIVSANTNYLPTMSLRKAVVCGRDSDSPRRPIPAVMRPRL